MTILSIEAVYPRRKKKRQTAAFAHVDQLDPDDLEQKLQECVRRHGVPWTFHLRVHTDDPKAGPFYECSGEVPLPRRTRRGRRGFASRVWIGRPTCKHSLVTGLTIPEDEDTLTKITIDPQGIVNQSRFFRRA